MIDRRLLLALPLLAAIPARAQPADALAAAVATGWTARGTRFTPEQVAARIAGRSGRAALLALAGAATSADEEEVETAIEIMWEAGQPPSPAEPLLYRDLVAGLPGVALDMAGQWWLITGHDRGLFSARHPISGETRVLARSALILIGRPVIAGA
ncbi:MAG: hypothetical protein KGQ52_08515 [Alphaproteobacteria bacterium]|nr:hypothetical protein [Alphaproteobacteria bacterium]